MSGKKGNSLWFKVILIILLSLFILLGLCSIVTIIINATTDTSYSETVTLLNKTDFSLLTDGFAGLSWSIVGTFILCLTLYYQRRDFTATKATSNKQQFENTFFNMLSMLIQLRNNISCDESGDKKKFGYEYLSSCITQLQKSYQELINTNSHAKKTEKDIESHQNILETDKEALLNEIQKIYEDFYILNHNSLGHYFRYIYHIIEFILEERKEYGDESRYMKILQAQLSDDELALLFYNGLSRYARKKNPEKERRFYNNMERYGFLENVDSDSLMSRTHYIYYPTTQFKFLNTQEIEDVNKAKYAISKK